MTSERRRGLILACLVLAPALPCRAEVGTATVLVRVTGPSGAWSGATLLLTHSDGTAWTGTADSRGWVAFQNVPPGSFKVDHDVQLFGPVECRPDLAVAAAEVLVIGLRLAASLPGVGCEGPAETVEDRFNLTDRSRLIEGGPGALPSGRNAWGLLETTEPAAVLDRIDGPGLYLGEAGRLSMHGSSWTQNSVVLDGVDTTDPLRGGTPLWYPDGDALEAIDVSAAIMPVERGAPGVTLALLPRKPQPSWGGAAQAYWLPTGLQARDAAGSPPSVARFGAMQDGSVVASGPVGGPALRLLVAARATHVSRFERADPAELSAHLVSLLASGVYRAGERDTLSVLTSLQSSSRPFAGRVRFGGAPVNERDRFLGLQPRFEHAGNRGLWSAQAGYQTGTFEAETEGRTPGQPVERLLVGPIPEVVFPGRGRRATWMMGANLALREDRLLGLSHAPRFGLTLSRGASSETPGPTGPTPETVNGLPARVWDYDYAGPEARRHVVDFAAYGAERLLWRDRGLVEAGLRFERTSGSADGARQGVTWQTLSPRVSARLRLTDRGRISLLGGYGEYQHRLLLQDLAFGDPAALQGSVYRWDDGNGNRLLDPGEQGVLVSRVGPGASDGTLAAIDPRLKAPRTRELVAGIEGRLGGDVAVRLTGFDRRERDLVESVNVGVPPSAYTVTYVPDPAGDIAGAQDDQLLPIYSRKPESFGQDRYLLTNPPNHTSHHQGLELRIEKAFGQRFRFLLGGTAYRTEAAGANRGFRVTENDQGVVGEIFDNPNADTYARGRTFFDRSYTLKGAAAYRFPWDMGASLVARYLDGQPFSRFVIAADLPQGPEAIEATPRGQVEGAGAMNAAGQYIVPSGHRFTFTLTVDARLEQGVRVRGHRLGLVAEVFNLLNTRNEVEEYAVGGPHFRDVAAVQPPRTFRFGLRYP